MKSKSRKTVFLFAVSNDTEVFKKLLEKAEKIMNKDEILNLLLSRDDLDRSILHYSFKLNDENKFEKNRFGLLVDLGEANYDGLFFG